MQLGQELQVTSIQVVHNNSYVTAMRVAAGEESVTVGNIDSHLEDEEKKVFMFDQS